MKKTKTILIDFLVLIAAMAGVTIVNILGTMILEHIFGPAMNPDGIPLTQGSTIAFLIMFFIAGMTAACIAAYLARSNPWILVGILLVIALVVDFIAITQGPPSELFLWAKIAAMVSIPPQIWVGAKIGIRLRGSGK
ncbi:MAG: hypothetical protein ACFCU6_13640 [Balneolaceae bacterium]